MNSDPDREIWRLTDAQKEFLDHAKQETGQWTDPEILASQEADRQMTARQTHEIARRLEANGVQAYRRDSSFVWRYWPLSDRWEIIPAFRNKCILPVSAASTRAGKVAALEFFLSRYVWAQFFTFTSGPRCGLEDLRERSQELTADLNRLALRLRKKWGLEMVFRSTEFGTVGKHEAIDGGEIEFDSSQRPLFHPHAHCILVSMTGNPLPPAKWDRMLADVWKAWGRHWDAGGTIRNFREACKYVTKPGEILRLSDAQLVEFYHAVSGLKLCQPLGRLKREIAARKNPEDNKPKKILRRYHTADGAVFREVDSQNQRARGSDEQRRAENNLRDAHRMARETAIAARTAPGNPVAVAKPAFCSVTALCSPFFGPSGLKEVSVIVVGTQRDEIAISKHPLVALLRDATGEEFRAGQAARAAAERFGPIRVHKITPTGTESPLPFYADIPEQMLPVGSPVWSA